VDLTHVPGIEHLRKVGWSAWSTASLGHDFPDTIAAKNGFTALVEWKSGKKTLTDGQRAFRDNWDGVVIVANSPEEAEAQLNAEHDRWFRK
jgi:hypothetical protein